jgi:hypothetical protein
MKVVRHLLHHSGGPRRAKRGTHPQKRCCDKASTLQDKSLLLAALSAVDATFRARDAEYGERLTSTLLASASQQ